MPATTMFSYGLLSKCADLSELLRKLCLNLEVAMRRFSLKMKLTLIYSSFLIIIIGTVLAILFSLSSREVLLSAQETLKRQVQKGVRDISYKDWELEVDADFYDLEQDVYLSLYDGAGEFLYGRIPYEFEEQPEFEEERLQTMSQGGQAWYVYDMLHNDGIHGHIYVRGITSVDRVKYSFRITQRFAAVLLPLLAVITAAACYYFTRRTLLPVKQMTDTVQQIQKDGDLSRRIVLPLERRDKNRDEIYTLAVTFDQTLERLEDSFEREKQFTSDISHELRTPVSVILAQCEELLQSREMPKEQCDRVRVVQKKAEDMAGMISKLLLLSRGERGMLELNREYLNLSELTLMCVQELESAAREKKITIETEIEPEVYACVDETLYIHMLDNLLSNAAAYGRQGGYIQVSLFKKEGSIIGTVVDDGIGISQADLPHIWTRFYRADQSRTSDGHVGLGLPMVKWIMEAHGGGVEAESRTGEGSTFKFFFPDGIF